MTAHCATCECSVNEAVPQPSVSSPGIRKLALDAAAAAVAASREKRKKPTEETA